MWYQAKHKKHQMFSLWQMTVIREIVKTGSISAAARQLGRPQPALSATVKELKKHQLTVIWAPKGAFDSRSWSFFLLDRANEILEQIDDLKQLLKSGGEATPTKINIRLMPVFGAQFFPRIIAKFLKNHPKTNFQIAAQVSPEVISSMKTKRFDIGLDEA